MQSRTLLNLGLLGALAALALVAYLEPGRTPEPEPRMLTGLQAAQVQRIELQRTGRPPLPLLPLASKVTDSGAAPLSGVTMATAMPAAAIVNPSLTACPSDTEKIAVPVGSRPYASRKPAPATATVTRMPFTEYLSTPS